MQYESQTPRRTPPPAFCPSCGAGVASATATCTVCGTANPAAKGGVTQNLGSRPETSHQSEIVRMLGTGHLNRQQLTQPAPSCARCGARLSRTAKFCRNCGEAVVEPARRRSEPLRKNVVPMPQPAPEPEAQNVPRLGRHISLAPLHDDEHGGDLSAPSKAQPEQDPLDYLDSQLGLTASDIAPARFKTPAWRLGRGRRKTEKAQEPLPEAPVAEPVAKPAAESVVKPVAKPVTEPLMEPVAKPFVEPPAPAPAAREPRTVRPSGAPTPAVLMAAGFALLALGIAGLVHYYAPNAVAGYSAAEFALKVQIRAVEWLLAGILVGIVGLLLKR